MASDENIVPMPAAETSNSSEWRQKQAGRVRRHTRLVVFLRIVLPSIAAVLVGLIILWPQLKAQKEEFSLVDMGLGKTTFPENQVMENPRLFVVDSKNRPVNITADTASEIPADKGRSVRMQALKADILMEKGLWLALDADTAVYTQEDNQVELQQKVNVYSDKGYELETTQATIDISSKNIVGKEEVFAKGRMGTLRADGFGIYEEGMRVTFSGNVRMILYPEEK